MSVKLCFYCKALVTKVERTDGTVLYVNEVPSPSSSRISRDTQTADEEANEDSVEVVFRSDSASVSESINEVNEVNE